MDQRERYRKRSGRGMRSVMRRALVPLLLLCLGCTTTTLSKRGATESVYARDSEACQKEARWGYIFHSDSRYHDCMLQRGYVIR